MTLSITGEQMLAHPKRVASHETNLQVFARV
jgi:hypothetical protein